MSFAYMPWYTGDYLRDTRHLTPLKHGIYLLLLAHCWDQKGPLPVDEQECSGIANCRSADEIEALRYVLLRYFVRMDDGWYNKRISAEIAKAEQKSQSYRESGLKSAAIRKARSMTREAIAEQRLNHGPTTVGNPNPNPILSLAPAPAKDVPSLERHGKPLPADAGRTRTPRGTRLDPGWQLPDDWKAWACAAYHLEPQRAVRISLAFRDYWIAKTGRDATKADWQATWRNWVRREVENA